MAGSSSLSTAYISRRSTMLLLLAIASISSVLYMQLNPGHVFQALPNALFTSHDNVFVRHTGTDTEASVSIRTNLMKFNYALPKKELEARSMFPTQNSEKNHSVTYILPVPKIIYTNVNTNISTSHGNLRVNEQLIADYHKITFSDAVHVELQLDNLQTLSICENAIQRLMRRSTSYFKKTIDKSNLVYVSQLSVFVGRESLTSYQMRHQISRISDITNDSAAYNEEYLIYISEPADRDDATFQLSCIIEIYANEFSGLLRALSSISQLMSSIALQELYLPLIIHDWPTHPWRGLLVDVARHFMPVPLLKRNIDAMEASKFNVLHLHLTDSQSFPLLLDDIPNSWKLSHLAKNGSFDYPSKIYTKQDMKDIVQYAKLRGIEVVPEVDMPAHSLSWGKSSINDLQGDITNASHSNISLVAMCESIANRRETPHNIYTLDPTLTQSRLLAKAVLTQLVEVFDSQYIHIGGDEVDLECWTSIPHIKQYMDANNMSVNSLLADFEHEIIGYVRNELKRTPVVWQGLLDLKALPDYNSQGNQEILIQPWKCWGGLAVRAATDALTSNYSVVMSACWYLDYDTDWMNLLSTDLIATSKASIQNNLYSQTKQSGHIFGGEGSIWTENVDHTNFECRVWPRAAAIATRLWGYEVGFPVMLPMPTSITKIPSNNHTTRSLRSVHIDKRIFTSLLSKISFVSSVSDRRRIQSVNNDLSLSQTYRLVAAFIHFRYHLVNIHGVQAALIVYHVLDKLPVSNPYFNDKTYPYQYRVINSVDMKPVQQNSELEAFEMLSRILNKGMTLSSSGRNPSLKSNNDSQVGELIAITSRCLGISESIQRPTYIDRIQIAQVNIADGANKDRSAHLERWMIDKASKGYLLIGLCELNGWQQLKSKVDHRKNFQEITSKAAKTGFVHSHVMANTQPFNIGAVSALPFSVVAEYGPPEFQRGVLHIFYASLELHVLILHLHAHSSSAREDEAIKISNICKPLLENNLQVVIMGDFNTLSPIDSAQHTSDNLLEVLQLNNHTTLQRLGKKFLTQSYDAINYKPMKTLLNDGFRDSCDAACRISDFELNGMSYSLCMKKNCPYTEPTSYNPEWTLSMQHPKIRLDYILLSEEIIRRARLGVNTTQSIISASTDISANTELMSDHFPVLVSWKLNISLPMFR